MMLIMVFLWYVWCSLMVKADIGRIIYSRKTKKIWTYFFSIDDRNLSEACISRCGIKERLSSSQHAGPLVALTITVPHEVFVKLGIELLESCHNTHVFWHLRSTTDGVGVLFTQHNVFGMRLELLDRISLDTAGLRTAETRINGLAVLYWRSFLYCISGTKLIN